MLCCCSRVKPQVDRRCCALDDARSCRGNSAGFLKASKAIDECNNIYFPKFKKGTKINMRCSHGIYFIAIAKTSGIECKLCHTYLELMAQRRHFYGAARYVYRRISRLFSNLPNIHLSIRQRMRIRRSSTQKMFTYGSLVTR